MTTKVSEHILSDFSMSVISSFKIMENKCDIYRDKNSMKKFCKSSKEHSIKIINSKLKRWNYSQTNSRNHIKIQKFVIFVKKKLKINKLKIKNIVKLPCRQTLVPRMSWRPPPPMSHGCPMDIPWKILVVHPGDVLI